MRVYIYKGNRIHEWEDGTIEAFYFEDGADSDINMAGFKSVARAKEWLDNNGYSVEGDNTDEIICENYNE